jgi:TusE/DsrC/DsvC family sulfur relay protein
MSMRTYAGQSVPVNAEGFLTNALDWTPEIAEEIAKEIGIEPLSARHWKVISFCREDAAIQGEPPDLRRIAELSGVKFRELDQLFPTSPGKLAARIAGLPNPEDH